MFQLHVFTDYFHVEWNKDIGYVFDSEQHPAVPQVRFKNHGFVSIQTYIKKKDLSHLSLDEYAASLKSLWRYS